MVFIEKKNIVTHYNCSKFNGGCPNKWYYSNEMYNFPACFEIDPTQRCYKAELSCQQSTRFQTDVLNTTLSALFNETSRTKDTNIGILYLLVIILPVIFLLGLIIAVVAWKMKRRMKIVKKNGKTDEGCSLLEIEDLVKISQEILNWNRKERGKFVKCMKKGNSPFYNGRGMVIGCAEAGKSTLVKKLRGEKDLNTKSISRIRVHSHLFKLNENESTITDEEMHGETSASLLLTQPNDASYSLSSSFKSSSNLNCSEDCKRSVSANNLKMLSLLDFSGHSAYYACHHIFFSPRTFYILVVDMTKKLDSVADEASIVNDLIYSNWTYADYIRYWLGSIHTYSSEEAPVILVFSHAEDNGANPEKAHEHYLKICEWLPEELRSHLDRSRVFSVEKMSDKNMEELKACIASTMKSENHWGETVPVSWINLEKWILKTEAQSRNIYFFSNLLRDVRNANDVGIDNEEDLRTALTFLHETGFILCSSAKRSSIILNVQWFVDAFKCIIMDETHNNIKDQNNFKDFDELHNHGILSKKLLIELWRTSNFYEHKRSLIYHMKELDMLAELSEEMWYVPCMNKQQYSCGILENCNVSSTLCFLFKILPFVIYHRLVVSCITNLGMKPWKSAKRMNIFHTVTILCCKDKKHRVLIGICENREMKCDYTYSIEIQTNVTKPRQIDNRKTLKLKTRIYQILTELTRVFPLYKNKTPFRVGYRCRIKPFSRTSDDNIIKEEDMSASQIDCSECKPVHVVDVTSILCFWKDGDLQKSVMNKKDEGYVDDNLICHLCSCVLKEPLQCPQCEDVFCKACIQEWLRGHSTCPVDSCRKPINPDQLRQAPRFLTNLLSGLQITCDNAGCTAVVALGNLSDHLRECQHSADLL
uniref:Uncharacterized protein LOC111103214 isoform X2 n=1 Tax=Crassostrea virginica TaxID=6565 RepID=A0A8B8AMY6_CRAVI|nr:uncharacterized protein LOC111103214 isoform X2 [Crassostrea virginica]